jgi:addiction module HigA family antidote
MIKLPPMHPGEVLREEFMEPLGLTPYTLADRLEIPRTRIERIAKEKTGEIPPQTQPFGWSLISTRPQSSG